MLLKICYKPQAAMIFDNVQEVNFESHLSNDNSCPVVIYENQDGGWTVHTECFNRVLFCKDFLKNQTGCSPVGNTDKEYLLNFVSFLRPDTHERELIAYTGSAYLCDASGKTIDVLR